MNLITNSGTNDFHGGVWEYLRNRVLDARNFFAAPGQSPQLIRNQFGGELGGPIRKDKVFFFAAYEGMRLIKALTNTGCTMGMDRSSRMGNVAEGVTLKVKGWCRVTSDRQPQLALESFSRSVADNSTT